MSGREEIRVLKMKNLFIKHTLLHTLEKEIETMTSSYDFKEKLWFQVTVLVDVCVTTYV